MLNEKIQQEQQTEATHYSLLLSVMLSWTYILLKRIALLLASGSDLLKGRQQMQPFGKIIQCTWSDWMVDDQDETHPKSILNLLFSDHVADRVINVLMLTEVLVKFEKNEYLRTRTTELLL